MKYISKNVPQGLKSDGTWFLIHAHHRSILQAFSPGVHIYKRSGLLLVCTTFEGKESVCRIWNESVLWYMKLNACHLISYCFAIHMIVVSVLPKEASDLGVWFTKMIEKNTSKQYGWIYLALVIVAEGPGIHEADSDVQFFYESRWGWRIR